MSQLHLLLGKAFMIRLFILLKILASLVKIIWQFVLS